MVKKRWLIYLFFLVIFSVSVAAQLEIGETLGEVGGVILEVFSLSWVTSEQMMVGLVRVGVAIIMFAGLFAGSQALKLDKRIGGMIALIMAIISAFFIPASVLLTIGGIWATIFSLVFIFGPIIGVLYLVYQIPAQWWGYLFRVIILVGMLIIYITTLSNIPSEGALASSVSTAGVWGSLLIIALIVWEGLRLVLSRISGGGILGKLADLSRSFPGGGGPEGESALKAYRKEIEKLKEQNKDYFEDFKKDQWKTRRSVLKLRQDFRNMASQIPEWVKYLKTIVDELGKIENEVVSTKKVSEGNKNFLNEIVNVRMPQFSKDFLDRVNKHFQEQTKVLDENLGGYNKKIEQIDSSIKNMGGVIDETLKDVQELKKEIKGLPELIAKDFDSRIKVVENSLQDVRDRELLDINERIGIARRNIEKTINNQAKSIKGKFTENLNIVSKNVSESLGEFEKALEDIDSNIDERVRKGVNYFKKKMKEVSAMIEELGENIQAYDGTVESLSENIEVQNQNIIQIKNKYQNQIQISVKNAVDELVNIGELVGKRKREYKKRIEKVKERITRLEKYSLIESKRVEQLERLAKARANKKLPKILRKLSRLVNREYRRFHLEELGRLVLSLEGLVDQKEAKKIFDAVTILRNRKIVAFSRKENSVYNLVKDKKQGEIDWDSVKQKVADIKKTIGAMVAEENKLIDMINRAEDLLNF